MKFYVYAYLREDQTPYYIGKGKGKRAWEKNHGVNVPEESRIVMIKTELSQQGAFDLEVKLIEKYGRKDLGTGILRNRTNGGEGTAGLKQTDEHKEKISNALKGIVRKPLTEERKQHLSKAMTGRAKSKETKLKLSAAHNIKSNPIGAKRSEETKTRMRLAQLGKKHSEETKQKMRETRGKNVKTTI
jgi:hypothetical protein